MDSQHNIKLRYYPIKWDGIFESFNLVRFETPMDGNCLFHAICRSFFTPYRIGKINEKNIDEKTIVTNLRRNLAEKLSEKNTDGKTYYENLHWGNTSKFAESVHEFEIDFMKKQLDSNYPIGYGYMEFIGNMLDKDIYILDGLRQDIYNTDELILTIKGDRLSIVLYYINGHYELVGIKKSTHPETIDDFQTFFSANHHLIQTLNHRVQEMINEKE